MRQIYQHNKENTTGISRIAGTDFGKDGEENQVEGFQYHDALWWLGEDCVNTARPPTLDLEETVHHFERLFSHIAQNLIATFNPKSVLELGCGNGMLSYFFRKHNPEIVTVTVDANQDVHRSPYVDHNHFLARTDKPLDFRDEDNNAFKFDLVISLEHFEHISEDTFDMLMENIDKHTETGSILAFTAAAWEYDNPEQEHVHCNIKTEDEWEQYISTYKFKPITLQSRDHNGKIIKWRFGRAGDTADIFAQKIK
jgi:2-polyprenyl-3-methyl-5-hydroxy-6-metoxy-1,4-benzoquinol methylase